MNVTNDYGEYECPVGFGLMFNPMSPIDRQGNSCGHKICRTCSLNWVMQDIGQIDSLFGLTENLHEPVACPYCKAEVQVYKKDVALAEQVNLFAQQNGFSLKDDGCAYNISATRRRCHNAQELAAYFPGERADQLWREAHADNRAQADRQLGRTLGKAGLVNIDEKSGCCDWLTDLVSKCWEIFSCIFCGCHAKEEPTLTVDAAPAA